MHRNGLSQSENSLVGQTHPHRTHSCNLVLCSDVLLDCTEPVVSVKRFILVVSRVALTLTMIVFRHAYHFLYFKHLIFTELARQSRSALSTAILKVCAVQIQEV